MSDLCCSSLCCPIQYGVLNRKADHNTTKDTDYDFHITRDTDSRIPPTSDNMYCLIPLAISVSHIPILSIHVTPIINLLLQFCCHLSFYNCLYFVSTLSTRKVKYLNILHVSYVHIKYNRMAYLELSCSLMLTCRSEIVKVPFIDVMLNP
jgi:hypothetical protein